MNLEVGVFQQRLAVAFILGRDQGFQQAVQLPLDALAQRLELDAPLDSSSGEPGAAVYHVQNPTGGFVTMLFAGILSGLLCSGYCLNDAGQFDEMIARNVVPFSYGKRRCPGELLFLFLFVQFSPSYPPREIKAMA